jgi:hypothetical protein
MLGRTQIAEPRVGAERQLIVPCDCVGACECLFVAEWDEGEGNENWQSFEFYSSYRVDTWRQRLKAAWLSLRGKQPFYHDIVTTPEQGRELGEWLLETLQRSTLTPGGLKQ